MNVKAQFVDSGYYHIYNRTNNYELLFRFDKNKTFFLAQLLRYLGGFLNFYSYALLSNHFHLSVSVKEIEVINSFILDIAEDKRTKIMTNFISSEQKEVDLNVLVSHQFQRFFISYTQAYNKMHKRKGNLLNRPFKRAQISSELKFGLNQYYIHHNARKHGIVKNFKNYYWTSYQIILSNEGTFLDRKYIFDWFGGRDAFIEFHEASHLEIDFNDIYLEG